MTLAVLMRWCQRRIDRRFEVAQEGTSLIRRALHRCECVLRRLWPLEATIDTQRCQRTLVVSESHRIRPLSRKSDTR